MKIIDALINSLPQDSPVKEVRVGPFWTAVVSRGCGLASTLMEDGHHHGDAPVRDAGRLTERSALELARLGRSPSLIEASIGMAAINSLLEVDETYCQELNAARLLMEKGKGRRVAIVGHFPFVPDLQRVARTLWVIEKRPVEGEFSEEKAEEVLPQADVVGITGTSLTNHTAEGLLGLCRPGCLVVMLGATTPLSPLLFDFGIHVISGTKVLDPATAIRCVGEAATFRQMRGVRLLSMMGERALSLPRD